MGERSLKDLRKISSESETIRENEVKKFPIPPFPNEGDDGTCPRAFVCVCVCMLAYGQRQENIRSALLHLRFFLLLPTERSILVVRSHSRSQLYGGSSVHVLLIFTFLHDDDTSSMSSVFGDSSCIL